MAAGLPGCLPAVAAAEKAVIDLHDIVGYADLTVLVINSASIILIELKMSHLSATRQLRYMSVLLNRHFSSKM